MREAYTFRRTLTVVLSGLLVLAAMSASAVPAAAQAGDRATLVVTGRAEIKAEPDMADFHGRRGDAGRDGGGSAGGQRGNDGRHPEQFAGAGGGRAAAADAKPPGRAPSGTTIPATVPVRSSGTSSPIRWK